MRRVSYHRVDGGGSPSPPAAASALIIESEAQRYVNSTSEQWMWEEAVDFDLLSSAQLVCELSALTKQSGGATGTYLVRIGGTIGVADGTVVATLVTSNAAYALPPDGVVGAAFARPSGRQLVKLSAASSLPGTLAYVRGYQVAFSQA